MVILGNKLSSNVETHRNASLPNKFGPQNNSLVSSIRGFKDSVTKTIRKNLNLKFSWQPRFYNHIVKYENDFENTQHHIYSNPENSKYSKIIIEEILFIKKLEKGIT